MSENRKAINIRAFLINTEYQHAWDEFVQNYISDSCSLSDQELIDYIQSVQHYALQEPSPVHSLDAASLLKALHYMSCIAYILASSANCERSASQEQLIKNLYLCINAINKEDLD